MHLNEFEGVLKSLKRLSTIEDMIQEQKEELKQSSQIIKDLKKIGFSVVIYNEKKIGLINYQIEKKEEKFYGIQFNLETSEFENKNYQKINDENLKKIKSILLKSK